MGYQNGPATITVTRDGQPVTWIISYEHKTFTAIVRGEKLGTWGNRTAGMLALGLVEVPAKRR